MMKNFFSILVCFAVLLASCTKNKCERNPSRCVEDSIEKFKSNKPCEDALVKEYKFQGKTVFVFESGTCGADMTNEVMDCECKILGYLGGISGNQTINGESFSNAQFVKLS